MAKQYDNNMTGALFTNDRKTNPKQPDYTGRIEVDNVEYWLAGWKKKSKAGKVFLSLAVTEKEEEKKSSDSDNFDDDIPF